MKKYLLTVLSMLLINGISINAMEQETEQTKQNFRQRTVNRNKMVNRNRVKAINAEKEQLKQRLEQLNLDKDLHQVYMERINECSIMRQINEIKHDLDDLASNKEGEQNYYETPTDLQVTNTEDGSIVISGNNFSKEKNDFSYLNGDDEEDEKDDLDDYKFDEAYQNKEVRETNGVQLQRKSKIKDDFSELNNDDLEYD